MNWIPSGVNPAKVVATAIWRDDGYKRSGTRRGHAGERHAENLHEAVSECARREAPADLSLRTPHRRSMSDGKCGQARSQA